ncbi:MAG TPA: hypothetical protein VIP57_14660 [Candidatus Dormibacteraeota bacterium]
MVGPQGGSTPPTPLARFSADGFWWWDGAEWKPALSQDGLWRWTGTGWVPAKPAGAGGGGTPAVGVTIGLVAGFLGVLVVVALVVGAILYAEGDQISTVFSNVVGTLASR